MKSTNTYTPRVVGALAIAIVAGAGGFLFFTSSKLTPVTNDTTSSQVTIVPSTATTTTTPTSQTTTPSTTSSSVYKDGSYTVSKKYTVPGGDRNTLVVTLSIVGDSITAVTTSNNIQDPRSQEYVDSFHTDISAVVVGNKLGNAYVGRVGGASLTSGAFNEAIDSIIASAKA